MNLYDSLDALPPKDLVVGHQRVYTDKNLLKDISIAGFLEVNFRGLYLIR